MTSVAITFEKRQNDTLGIAFVKKGIVFWKKVGKPLPGAFEKKALIQTAACPNMVGYVFL